MAVARLFGARPPGAITIVDAPVSRSFAQKARLAFFTVGSLGAVLASVALSAVMSVALAVLVGVLSGLVVGLAVAVLVLAWPVLRVLWWWAFELTAVALVWGSATWLASVSAPWVPLAVLAVVAVVVALMRPVRRWLVAWSWCVVVRHRLRLCFAQFVRAASRTQPGSLPLMLWARPTPAGERVWVWLRPGLDLSDLDGKAGKFAVACWSSEVRVVRASARFAALLRVDVTRRDPLTGTVVSPLAALFAGLSPVEPVASAVPVGLALDLDEVPESAVPVAPAPMGRGRR